MQSIAKKNPRNLRRFKVGIVGVSSKQLDVITRVLNITKYRTRCYDLIELGSSEFEQAASVDFVIICSENPNIIQAWEHLGSDDQDNSRANIYLTRPNSKIRAKYQLSTPVNPAKLIKMLDDYTIKELNFLPEFEIGHDSHDLKKMAVTGLKLLKSNNKPTENSSRALVVDDSLAVRKQLQIEFQLLNSQLDTVASAEEAMEAVETKQYDIIFLDVIMPGMDGYAACKQIKKSSLNRGTPVIMLTSRSSSFDKIKGTLAGCNAYLVKPINHNEFEEIYKKHVINAARGRNNASE